jgi:RNA polymerase primary sigma factor
MRALKITRSITRRDEQSLNRYLNEISKFQVLTPDEEVELFRKVRAGSEQAFSMLILKNLRFVVSVAKQYQYPGMWLGDLINEGNIGLIKAAHRFDETRGFKFISYAVWWIRQAILQSLNEKSRNVRLPMNLIGNMTKINTATTTFLQKKERLPTDEELVEMTDLSLKVIKKCLKNYQRSRSLDAPVSDDSTTTLVGLMADNNEPSPDTKMNQESLKIEVEQILKLIPERQGLILQMYFGINRKYPLSLDDIGLQMGLTRERVRQIKDKGISRLRQGQTHQNIL